jgi:hypothetical protein
MTVHVPADWKPDRIAVAASSTDTVDPVPDAEHAAGGASEGMTTHMRDAHDTGGSA